MPILGYDIDPRGGRLTVNEAEAVMVREIFGLYETMPSLTRVVEELGRRGWRRKSWTLRSGEVRKGAAFDKLGLLHLLRNPLYIGKVPHRDALYPGEHSAIIDETAWDRVQAKLSGNGSAGYQGERSNSHALLKGLLHCAHCGCAMTPSHAVKGARRYRYYVCQTRLKKGGSKRCQGLLHRYTSSGSRPSRRARSGTRGPQRPPPLPAHPRAAPGMRSTAF
jgi:site-specific DNA recombinase